MRSGTGYSRARVSIRSSAEGHYADGVEFEEKS